MSSKKGAQSGGLQVTGKVEHGWSRKLLVPEQRYVEFVDSLYSSSYRVLFCFIFGRLTNRKISSLYNFITFCKMWIFKSSFQKYDAIHSFVIQWNS